MSTGRLTRHAEIRMAQRGIRGGDLEVGMAIGTEIEDGILVLEKDCDREIRPCKRRIEQVRRLKGMRIVLADDCVVTVGSEEVAVRRGRPRGCGGCGLNSS